MRLVLSLLVALIFTALAPVIYEVVAAKYLAANWHFHFDCPRDLFCELSSERFAQTMESYVASDLLWLSMTVVVPSHLFTWIIAAHLTLRNLAASIVASALVQALLNGLMAGGAAFVGFTLLSFATDSPDWEVSMAFGDDLTVVAAAVFAGIGAVTGGIVGLIARPKAAAG
jgi:hypothetical protein